MSMFTPHLSFSQCSMVCNSPNIQISLGSNCLAIVNPDDILEGSNSCAGPLSVEIFDLSGNLIPNNPIVDGTYLDQTLPVRVVDAATGNYCESTIVIRDYINPVISCINLNIVCTASTHPDDIGYANVSDNCDGNPTLSYIDDINNPMCDPSAVQIITRTWTAIDDSGNEAVPCVQTITLLRPILGDIQFPLDRNGIAADALNCVNPDVSPDSTGYPILNGLDLINGDVCELWVMYTDAGPFAICDGSYSIIRTWTINEECTGNSTSETQEIKVLDSTGPVINCADDFTVSASATTCNGSFIIPNATATDDCSSNANITISIEDENGQSVNPGAVVYLPVGVYTYTYTATDDCGNTSVCTLDATIDDGANPVAICNSFTTISLGNAGTTLAPASTFDDGSYDNCGPITFLARRMDNPDCPGNDASVFGTEVPFYCCDIGTTVMVEMRIEDAINRLSNSCMVEVIVQDKLNPEITCPPDITISCTTYEANPSITGEPEVYDNCGVMDVSYTDVEDLNLCNTGTITRTWTVQDNHGQSAVCVQLITLVDTTVAIITFPESIDEAECGDSDDLTITGEPEVEDNCGSFAINHDDTVIEFADECLIKIIRVWTVYDWCNDVTYTDVQVIKEFDTEAPVFSGIPTDLTVECDAVPAMEVLTADDLCGNGEVVTTNEVINPGSCTDEYSIIRKWFTVDNCGNADSLVQVITVVDTTPPVILGESPDTTLNCDAIIPMPIISATDNCDLDVDLDMTEVITDGACADEYMIVRTWTASDNCGNQTIQIQNISVQDTVAPTLIGIPTNLTVECDMIPDPSIVTAMDNCDQNVTIAFEEISQPGSCPENYTLVRTWTATDNCGNESSQSQSIIVDDNTPPVLSGMPIDMTVECGNVPDAPMITATDNCDTDVEIMFDEDIQNGICAEDITIVRTWTATDNCGNTISASQTITSSDTEAPVLIGVPVDMTVECGAIMEAPEVTAIDNCASNIMVDFSETEVNGDCAEDVVVTRIWTATDNCGNEVSAIQVITSADIVAPILIGIPADVTAECGEIPAAPTVTATDNCLTDVIVDFDEEMSTGTCSEDVIITRTWTATDNCGNTVSAQQVVSSSDIIAPTLNNVPVDMTVDCGMVPEPVIVTASDNCDMDVIVVFAEVIEDGICPENITVTRTWMATDNCGNTVSATQVITSSDTEAPVLSATPVDMTVECGEVPNPPTITATDNCITPEVVFTEVIEDGICPENITVTRTWTATDNCGNTVNTTQVITSSDTEAPILTDVPDDMTVQCDAIPSPVSVSATDNCDDEVTIVFEEIITEQNCENEYVLTWSWTATDNCGNTSSRSTTLEVIDDTAPVLFGIPQNITVECNDIPALPSPTATDNCDDDPEISFEEFSTEPDCGSQNYQIFRTWTATDNCSNLSARTQIITLFDESAPVFTVTPPNITAECDNIPSPAFVEAEDACNNGAVLMMTEEIVENSGDCTHNYILNRTWTATDSCGNSDTFTQEITVDDTTPPTISCPNDRIENIVSVGVCDFLYAMSVTITDNCDQVLDVDYSVDFGNDGVIDSVGTIVGFPFLLISFPIGDNTITFNATDDCGNTSSCSSMVMVNDLVPPAFFCNPQTVPLSGIDSSGFVVPSQFLLEPFLECCLDTLLIEDLDNPGQMTDTLFLDYDDFILSQMIGGIPIEIFAIDCYGNMSSCVTKVFVLPPMSPPGFAEIAGEVLTEEGEPLENIEVFLDGGMSDDAMTSVMGAYEFLDLPEGYPYYIEPFHNQDPMNGVTTWDLILLQRHILEVDLLDSPYKIIAGDINRSGQTTTFDIVQLRKLILGINTVFQSNTSWRFVDANYVFPNQENPFESSFPEFCSIASLENEMMDMSFVAVKTGDLNNSAETNFNGTSDTRNASTFHFETENQSIEEDEEVIVPIKAKDFDEVLGFQFTLDFDQSLLDFEGLGANSLSDFSMNNFGLDFIENGMITCSWFDLDASTKDSETILFELKFKAKGSGRLSELLKINSNYTTAELYQKDKTQTTLDLQFGISPKVDMVFELFQNRPNPFKEETIISFSLKESSIATISVFNASGELVWKTTGVYPEGYSEFVIQRDELEGSGLYFYQLRTESALANQRMILIE